jgi:hypothetical protein
VRSSKTGRAPSAMLATIMRSTGMLIQMPRQRAQRS